MSQPETKKDADWDFKDLTKVPLVDLIWVINKGLEDIEKFIAEMGEKGHRIEWIKGSLGCVKREIEELGRRHSVAATELGLRSKP
jgi:hypothetical protein